MQEAHVHMCVRMCMCLRVTSHVSKLLHLMKPSVAFLLGSPAMPCLSTSAVSSKGGGLKGLDALFKLGALPLHSLPSCLQLALPILADLQLERSQPAAVLPMGNQTWISCIQSQLGCQAWLNHGCVGIFRRMRPWGGVLSQWTCDVTLSPILWV